GRIAIGFQLLHQATVGGGPDQEAPFVRSDHARFRHGFPARQREDPSAVGRKDGTTHDLPVTAEVPNHGARAAVPEPNHLVSRPESGPHSIDSGDRRPIGGEDRRRGIAVGIDQRSSLTWPARGSAGPGVKYLATMIGEDEEPLAVGANRASSGGGVASP